MGREDLKTKAKEHTDKMAIQWREVIEGSVKALKIYDDFKLNVNKGNKDTKVFVKDMDTVSAVFEFCDKTTGVLSFASYKYPGGGFIVGSKAQEECICHESTLYNVISQCNDFYDWNAKNTNRSLYLNRGIYVPNIMFEKGNGFKCADVISVAAPNKAAAVKNFNVSDSLNTKYLRERIRFILNIAVDNNVETLILGAFGCGVFGQDPYEVAKIFRSYLENEFKGCFSTVVFAIPKGNNSNFVVFRSIFSGFDEG